MKAFVIKNKEGKYLQYFTDMYRFDFTDRLINAMFYEQWEQDSINYALKTIPDCNEVVEITIAEGDLEQQLADKNKEINKLQQIATIDMQAKEILELQVATIRKQVCNEIREFIDNNEHSEENEAKQSSESVVYTKQLCKFLDQIEQGVQQ